MPDEHSALVHTFAALPETRSAPISRAEFATPIDAPLLLALARLHRHKGLDVLIKAMSDVPGAYLWLAGEGEERAALERLTASLDLQSRIRFLGWRNDRERLLSTADICVVRSRYESFGTVMAEAWAAEVPLVACAAQGPAAYVKGGETGMLVPMDDPTALALAIGRVLTDARLRARLVACGRRFYEQHFTKEAYVRSMLGFYQSLLGNDLGADSDLARLA